MWRASFNANAEALPKIRPHELVSRNSKTRVGTSEIPTRKLTNSSEDTTSRLTTPTFTMRRCATRPTSFVAIALNSTIPIEFTPNTIVNSVSDKPRIFCSTNVEPEMYENSAPNAKHIVSMKPR